MDLSKLKIEAYDLLAIIIPGLLAMMEFLITLRGWSDGARVLLNLNASVFTLALLIAFAFGQVIQEAADAGIKAWRGERFFKQARDKYWEAPEGELVRRSLKSDTGKDIESVDTAFDCCLTRIGSDFPKRDLFLANSDLARSLVLVSLLAIAPVARVAVALPYRRSAGLSIAGAAVLLLIGIARLLWQRMKRFRDLSETPVFNTYLAQGELEARKTSVAAR